LESFFIVAPVIVSKFRSLTLDVVRPIPAITCSRLFRYRSYSPLNSAFRSPQVNMTRCGMETTIIPLPLQ